MENIKVWHAVEVEIARVAEVAATTQLWSFGTTGIEFSEDASDFITLRAYFDVAPDIERIRLQIVHGLKLMDLPEDALRGLKCLVVADQDWLAEWKRGFEPIEIGERLLIAPSWKLDEVKDSGRIVVQIDPGMAFGTGTHETTRGCLEMLEKFWRGGALLDIGTGTGILAIAAAKLAPGSRVLGFDVDPEAIAVAHENASLNGLVDEIELEVNKLSSYPSQNFDLVLANLTADVILPLAADLARVVKQNGVLVISGVLREQGDKITTALEAQNLRPIETKPDGEWLTFALQSQQ